MQKTATTLFLLAALAASPVLAGSLADPIVEPSVIVNDTVESSGQLEGILATLAVITILLGAAGAF